jgi:hypothetical protein
MIIVQIRTKNEQRVGEYTGYYNYEFGILREERNGVDVVVDFKDDRTGFGVLNREVKIITRCV